MICYYKHDTHNVASCIFYYETLNDYYKLLVRTFICNEKIYIYINDKNHNNKMSKYTILCQNLTVPDFTSFFHVAKTENIPESVSEIF